MSARGISAGITRRVCLGGMAFAWLAGNASRAQTGTPERIACLEWTSAEMAISLGLVPLCLCDLRGYEDWVVAPDLASSILDLGSRSEPNLEMLRDLQPHLITGAYGYGLEESDFKRFAPTFNVPFYDGTMAPYAQAQKETRRLGAILGRSAEAEALVFRVENTVAHVREQMGNRATRPLCIVSMFDDRHVRVYGAGSLFQDILSKLGLTNAWTKETNTWGFSSVGIEELVSIGDATLISLDPIPKHVKIRIDQSTLWNNLPCVRNGKVITIPAVWPFGGLAAAERFASLLAMT
ncbi:ABC transporter substrate-binding protein [Phyllobacterium myrsinacearum]|uniref:Iron complex transport system substrate-binding protein n=1 Tax=Phyllobacterium myrsinacearum TaxID=28101 RepID=A0A839EJI0_9HYPH|nr:iron complex transport system substrate-binding protein [Phyllobacterium myrsinacearum]